MVKGEGWAGWGLWWVGTTPLGVVIQKDSGQQREADLSKKQVINLREE